MKELTLDRMNVKDYEFNLISNEELQKLNKENNMELKEKRKYILENWDNLEELKRVIKVGD